MRKHLFLLIPALFASGHFLLGQVPEIISYQGRVAVGGAAFHGVGRFKFAVVNGNATESLWSNDITSTGGSEPASSVLIGVSNGLFAVLLGDASLSNMTAIPQ